MDDDPQRTPELFRRLFTPAEANALLPEVIPVLVQLRSDREDALSIQRRLERLTPAMRSNGAGNQAAALEDKLRDLAMKIAAGVRRITGLGIHIKDLDHGLIDFPSERDGRVIYLCWHLGEDQIAFWHDLDGGFAGRQPL